jgi:hypothetical protein
LKSQIIIALVVLVTITGHVALYRWVKFKIHEGVILKFLRDAREGGASESYQTDAIAVHTEISTERVAVVCRKSVDIHCEPEVENSWRAS